jgi:predicted phage tail protein
MTTRAWGILFAVVGGALLVVSVLADPIGVGGTDEFGWKQVAGSVVGAVLLLGGVALMFLPLKEEVEPGAGE